MTGIIQIRARSMGDQVNDIIGFVANPDGLFETADRMTKRFRRTNKTTWSQMGLTLRM